MAQPAKVATPPTATLASESHPNVALGIATPGPAAVSVRCTVLVSCVSVAPEASSTVTTGCVAMFKPPVESPGCVLNANFVGLGTGAVATMPTIGDVSVIAPAEPKNPASPNAKTPPSAATNQ